MLDFMLARRRIKQIARAAFRWFHRYTMCESQLIVNLFLARDTCKVRSPQQNLAAGQLFTLLNFWNLFFVVTMCTIFMYQNCSISLLFMVSNPINIIILEQQQTQPCLHINVVDMVVSTHAWMYNYRYARETAFTARGPPWKRPSKLMIPPYEQRPNKVVSLLQRRPSKSVESFSWCRAA
jgi:hypothetical protein